MLTNVGEWLLKSNLQEHCIDGWNVICVHIACIDGCQVQRLQNA